MGKNISMTDSNQAMTGVKMLAIVQDSYGSAGALSLVASSPSICGRPAWIGGPGI